MVTRLQTKDDLTWQRQALDLGSGLRLGSLRFLRLRVLFVQGCFVRCSTQQPPSADRSGRGAHTTAVQREADTRTHTTQTEKTGKRRLKGRQGKGGSADALSWSSQSCAANVFSGLSLLGSAASAAVSGSTGCWRTADAPPSSDCSDTRTVRTLKAADHLSCAQRVARSAAAQPQQRRRGGTARRRGAGRRGAHF